MATIRPFQALRPQKDKAALTSAVPYDVVNTSEARDLAAGNPWSFLHVSRPEIDLPDGTDPYSDIVYQKAVENFGRLRRNCPLISEDAPSLYIYRLRLGGHEQTGIAACSSVADYDAGVIRKHERTRKDKEDDRTRHILELRAQTGPVFLTYRGRDEIDRMVKVEKLSGPLYDFTAPDRVQHTIWRVSADSTRPLVEAFRQVPVIYIADGHHRAASASRAAARLKSENPDHTGGEEYNSFLSVLFPAAEVSIMPYNRVVKDLNGLAPDRFLRALTGRFKVSDGAEPRPLAKGSISMYMVGRWYALTALPAASSDDPISSLDVSVLQDQVLDPLLGIRDVRTDRRIEFVGGIRGTRHLERLVDEGRAAVAFSLYPVTVDELMFISDANRILPPKSTWFEPKVRDGLLIHVI